jgi:hypothetical protein
VIECDAAEIYVVIGLFARRKNDFSVNNGFTFDLFSEKFM